MRISTGTLVPALALLALGACVPIPPAPVHATERLPGKARLEIKYTVPTGNAWQDAIADPEERKAVLGAEGDLGKQRMKSWIVGLGLFEDVREGEPQPTDLVLDVYVGWGQTSSEHNYKEQTEKYKVSYSGTLTVKSAQGLVIAQYRMGSDEFWKKFAVNAMRASMEDVETKLLKALVEDRAGQTRMRAVMEGKFVDPSLTSGLEKLEKNDMDGAFQDLSAAIQHNEKSAAAWGARARVRAGKMDFKGALDDAAKALELDPAEASGYRSRGTRRAPQPTTPN